MNTIESKKFNQINEKMSNSSKEENTEKKMKFRMNRISLIVLLGACIIVVSFNYFLRLGDVQGLMLQNFTRPLFTHVRNKL
jgi:hypothetical protein